MKTYQTITIPAQPERDELRAVAIICDLCNCTISNLLDNGIRRPNQTIVDRYGNAFSVTVELKAGEHNLDGGAGETTSFDLCPQCFEIRLIPWLESWGAEARVEGWHS